MYCRQSFGYDCQKRSNLLLIDEDTLLYGAGNLLVLFKISSREQTYLRTLGGGGIGAITVCYIIVSSLIIIF